MAVDTRDKRFSMLGLFQPVPSLLPNPDGSINVQDRAMLLYLYYGIALESLALPQSFGVYAVIDAQGKGVIGAISTQGQGVSSEIVGTFGKLAIIDSTGLGIEGELNSTGKGVEGEI